MPIQLGAGVIVPPVHGSTRSLQVTLIITTKLLYKSQLHLLIITIIQVTLIITTKLLF
jgi:hypothetical protein